MNNKLPDTDEELRQLLERVDRQLTNEGFPIPSRPLHALRVISAEFNTPLPITPPFPSANDELRENWPFSQRVYEWYDERYGNRLKVNFGPGRMVFLIRGDPWVFRFPRIYGSVLLTASRDFNSQKIRTDGQPALFNVLDSIQDFPRGLRASLADDELSDIYNHFLLGFFVFSYLEEIASNNLINSALADIAASVNHIMDHDPNYGLSKWSSLQAAEKLIKAIISAFGGKYSRTHDLSKLVRDAENSGISLSINNDLLDRLHCVSDIRYGQAHASFAEAISAHHAVFELAKILHEKLKPA